MARAKKQEPKKISFKTKSGKEVVFSRPSGKAKVSRAKSFEKRLSAMEKAILNYNHAVQAHQERKKSQSGEQVVGKSGKQGDKPAKGKKPAPVVVDVGKERA